MRLKLISLFRRNRRRSSTRRRLTRTERSLLSKWILSSRKRLRLGLSRESLTPLRLIRKTLMRRTRGWE